MDRHVSVMAEPTLIISDTDIDTSDTRSTPDTPNIPDTPAIVPDSPDNSTSSIEEEDHTEIVKLEIKDVIPLEFFINYFERYDDEEFVSTINAIIQEYVHLSHENDIFVQYLKDNEPSMLSSYEEACKKIKELEKLNPLLPRFFEMSEEVITADMMPFVQGVQINVSTRIDLAARYMDELKVDMARFQEKVLKISKRCKAQISEANLRIEEIEDAIAAFEQNIVIDGVDPITQRIPAEKFVQFMREWMKKARFITERIRLNISYMKVTHAKLNALYEQKAELGVSLSNSDFEALRIRNDHLAKQIEQKNAHLVELKQMLGTSALELSTTKKILLTLGQSAKRLQNSIQNYEKDTQKFMTEIVTTSKDLSTAEANYHKVKKVIDHCKAPDTLSYLRVKHHQTELIKKHRVLCRQENLMNITRKTYEMNLMRLMRRKTVDPEWYEPCPRFDDDFPPQAEATLQPISSEFDIFKAINVKPIATASSMSNPK